MLLFLIALEVVVSVMIILKLKEVNRILRDGERFRGYIVEVIEELNSENDVFFYPIVKFVDKKGESRKIKINDERYSNSFVIGEVVQIFFNEKVDYVLPEGSIWIKWWPVIQWIIAFLVVSILIIAYILC